MSDKTSIILTAAVGFVRDVQHNLVSACSASLEETALADLLLHVVDSSHPDYERQIEDVNTVLAEIGADKVPQLLVYNKIDLLPSGEREPGLLCNAEGRALAANISVQESLGLDDLRKALIDYALDLPSTVVNADNI